MHLERIGDHVKYRTIVADPPWRYDRTSITFKERIGGEFIAHEMPYPMLSLEEIRALPIGNLAKSDAHLYLWTTQRYLRDSFGVAENWGFKPSVVLIWCKAPHGFNPGGTFGSTVEFILFARRGSLRAKRREQRQWWEWPRGPHSAKPEAFLDIVESVSPGPYLELFARRNRLGWDTWGNEAINHLEIGA